MKKKLTALLLAAVMVMSSAAVFAQNISVREEGNTKAIVLCFGESGALVYSKLVRSADGDFNIDVPAEYDNTKKKLYLIDTQEFKALENFAPEPTASPEQTATPAPAATEKPAATPKATKEPLDNTPYEKEVDKLYAPAMVTDVSTGSNDNNETVYNLTLYYLGEEVKLEVKDDLKIRTAPDAYADMRGETAGSLQEGDVICLTFNFAGDKVRYMDFITRPVKEDIITGSQSYGTSFEKLFSSGGTVAGQWGVMLYGNRTSGNRYQYVYGAVGKKNGNLVTLVNKSTDPDDVLEIEVSPKAYVYACDVDGKNYDFELGAPSDITTDIPQSVFNKDTIELSSDYSYNYALMRVVDGTATDVVLYNNYNN